MGLELDHQRYLDDRAYRRDVHARLRQLLGASLNLREVDIFHEPGHACCAREAWPVTHARLLAALAADGDRMLGVQV